MNEIEKTMYDYIERNFNKYGYFNIEQDSTNENNINLIWKLDNHTSTVLFKDQIAKIMEKDIPKIPEKIVYTFDIAAIEHQELRNKINEIIDYLESVK